MGNGNILPPKGNPHYPLPPGRIATNVGSPRIPSAVASARNAALPVPGLQGQVAALPAMGTRHRLFNPHKTMLIAVAVTSGFLGGLLARLLPL